VRSSPGRGAAAATHPASPCGVGAPRSSAPPEQPLRIETFGAVSAFRPVAVRLRRTAFRRRCLPGSDRFVASAAAGMATRPGRPLPARGLHPLERHTSHGARGPAHRVLRTTCVVPPPGFEPLPLPH
jgi:hypothetical protein